MGISKDLEVVTMKASLLFLCLAASGLANPLTKTKQCGSGNDYVDLIMGNVQQMIVDEGYDPIDLPKGEASFSQDIGFITVHGSAGYDRGYLEGLSSIHRAGDAELCSDTNTITIDAGVGVNKMKAGYHVSAKFQGIHVGASAKVAIDGADISFKAKADVANGDLGLKIKDFDIDKLGHISV